MATQPRQQMLPRLFIPPSLNSQQPMSFAEGAPMFAAGLPSSIQQSYHPPFAMHHNPLQTPMQPAFFPQPPGAPGRPALHRSHPSVAQLAAAGILPPPGIPMTPLGQNGFPQPLIPGLQPFAPPFVPRSKRSSSVSVGGPPKAVLGGPQRKVSPLPPNATVTPASAPAQKAKKVIVNFPCETIPGEGDAPPTRASFARTPLRHSEVPEEATVRYPELTTIELYPTDSWRYHLPSTVDVFLPGKTAWDTIKRSIIEEKLEKLGVERGSGSSVPHILAPHARAASISSPADPALLFFKLNKLQQSQNASSSNSLSTSPQPPINLTTPPPNQLPPRFQNRHGHSMSLVQPPSYQSPPPHYHHGGALNPFGPNATLGSDQILQRLSPAPIRSPLDNIIAPQGRVPANLSSLAPPQALSRPESRPDFMRGFGLDITEEEEEPEEEVPAMEGVPEDSAIVNHSVMQEEREEVDLDGVSTVGHSRIHSRHVSRLSAALSLISVGGVEEPIVDIEVVPERSPIGDVEVEDVDQDLDEVVGEWTGSEDLHTAETSEDESIGEWSNPSDEERARQERLHRRMLRRVKQVKQELEIPRRLPNFPRPPGTAPGLLQARVDDDIVSNPSEDGNTLLQDPYLAVEQEEYYSRPSSKLSGKGRPLPPLPHSRTGSSQLSNHDPALAHSRTASEQRFLMGGLHPRPVTAATVRTEALNPHAKPFVFGMSTSWPQNLPGQASAPSTVPPNHTRTPSVGKPLNAAALEFKPTGFTFRPPPGVPQLAFVTPQSSRPLPVPPEIVPTAARASQGREKRQRRGSSVGADGDGEDEDGVNNMSSFKFPPSADDVRVMRHSAPASPPSSGSARDFSLNTSTKPFTFSGFASSLPFMPKETTPLPHPLVSTSQTTEGDEENLPIVPSPDPIDEDAKSAEELPFPPAAKPKRAPIPLDFKHPVSTNTVPAGLFKALVNGESEERTRRAVRSRLSSRDIYEHSPRQSLDDFHVPRIGRARLFTEPGLTDISPGRGDVFSVQRRRSLPPRHILGDEDDDSGSEVLIPPITLARRVEMQQYEQRLEVLLEEKFGGIRQALEEYKQASSGQALNASAEAMISEVVSLFHAQLQASAAKSLEDSQMDARGEFDFEMIKDVIEQSHAESRAIIQKGIAELRDARERVGDIEQVVEDLSERTVNAVMASMSQLVARVQAMENSRLPAVAEREILVRDLATVLLPQIASLRPDPIDYETLTNQLTQAVKPHISQLIDLASDKRETAGLIVDRLVPVIPSLYPPLDMEAIVGALTTEVRKIIGPLDAHEMKEQVSDLVVERLDSRLAVRDKTFNVDILSEKVVENLRTLLGPLQAIQTTVDSLAQKEQSTVVQGQDQSSIRQDILDLLSDIPGQMCSATEALSSAEAEFVKYAQSLEQNPSSSKSLHNIEAIVSDVANEQRRLASQNQEFSDFCSDIIKHINALPEAMVEATKVLQNAHADFAARDSSQKDSEEIRRQMAANAELQVQLAKARGAHGQVRVEKDILIERLKTAEDEGDRLSAKVDTLQTSIAAKASEATATEARNAELEEALARALERVKAADVQAQTAQERLSQLEKANHELGLEKQQLKSKVDSLNLRVTFVTREKESIGDELSVLRKQNEDLTSQQNHWDELRRASEQIQMLANLVGQADTEEIQELRRIRDRSKVLEGEHAALQRRLKEYETKTMNSEKVAQASRQSLAQAQQRAVEWEQRTKEYEGQLELNEIKLEQAEQAHAQLDADYSVVKLRLEERDAEERLDRDRQNKLRDQIASLEAQVARLQAEVDQSKKAAAALQAPLYQNGHSHPPPRPDSRASTIYGESRGSTPLSQYNGVRGSSNVQVLTPPQPSVWDSIHAPNARHENPIRIQMTPKAKRLTLNQYYRPQIPSPTPSNVSAAPTLGDDGWWA